MESNQSEPPSKHHPTCCVIICVRHCFEHTFTLCFLFSQTFGYNGVFFCMFFSRSLLIFNPSSLLANRCSRPQDNFTLIRTVNHAHLAPLPAGMITPAPTKESPSNGCCIISHEPHLNLSLTIQLVTCGN